VASPEVFVGREEVHRAAFAAGAAGGLAEHLGHQLVHVHASGQAVAVIAIGGDGVVVLAEQGLRADDDRFLADVEMEEAADLAGVVGEEARLLELADARHLPVEVDLGFLGQGLIDRGFGVVGRGRLLGHKSEAGDASKVRTTGNRGTRAIGWRALAVVKVIFCFPPLRIRCSLHIP